MTKTAIQSAEEHAIDAITLLTENHKKVINLFTDFTKLAKAHVKEKEGKMFPKVRQAKLERATLGEALADRMHELQAAMNKNREAKAKKRHLIKHCLT